MGALKGNPFTTAREKTMCELSVACTSRAAQVEGARSSGDAFMVVVFCQDSLPADGCLDHDGQDAWVTKHVPLWLASHLDLARVDPQSALRSSLDVAILGVPRKGKELQVHCHCSLWL